MKSLFAIIGFLAVLTGAGLLIFKYVVPHENQRKVLQEMGMENAPVVSDLTNEAFIECEEIIARKNIVGKWVVSGSIFNRHPSKAARKVKLRFVFSEGSEERTIETNLNPEAPLPKIFREKISGHSEESFEKIEVLSVE